MSKRIGRKRVGGLKNNDLRPCRAKILAASDADDAIDAWWYDEQAGPYVLVELLGGKIIHLRLLRGVRSKP